MQWAIALAALGVVNLAPPGLANGTRLVSQDAFASGRGEAFVATADNPSAIYYNPAGLTQLAGDELRGGVYALHFNIDYRPPPSAGNAGNRYEVKQHWAAVPQLFYAHTAPDGAWSAGFGFYAPHGADVRWPQDTGFRTIATAASLKYLRAHPVVAVRLAPTLSVAAGLMLDYADFTLEQGLLRTERPFANQFVFQGDGVGAAFNVGARWQPAEALAFGLTFRSATEFNLTGRTEFQQAPIIPPTQRKAKAEFEFPWTLAAGVSWRPAPEWNFEVNADYTDWSTLNSALIRQATPPPFPVRQNIPVTLGWEGSWLLSAGATRTLGGGWHASAGYAWNQSSVPDDFYSPLAADLDRHFITLGAGHRGRRWDFDVTYQLGIAADRTVTGSRPPSQPGQFSSQRADGTYGFASHALFVSVGRRF